MIGDGATDMETCPPAVSTDTCIQELHVQLVLQLFKKFWQQGKHCIMVKMPARKHVVVVAVFLKLSPALYFLYNKNVVVYRGYP